MGKCKIKLAGLILLLFLTGCTKNDEFKRPVKVFLKIGVSTESSTGPQSNQYLDFTECQIGIQTIQFEGKRETGGDIYFETDSKIDLQTITFLKPVIISEFDIPQGIYYYMKWDIYMKCMVEFTQCTGIVIRGQYSSTTGSGIPFVLTIEQPEEFSIRASDPENKSTIVLSAKKDYEATVLLDPVNAFSTITRESFENAEISYENGNPEIVISRIMNEDLYMILLDRIFKSVKVIVKNVGIPSI